MSKALYIAEKPSVAQEFAKALKINGQRRDGYLESQDSVVTWCVGHLVTMSYPEKYDIKYKRWSLDTLPFLPREFKYEVIPGVQKQFEIVKGLLNREDVDTIYVCTDSGREGEYIYRLVAQMAGVHGKKEKRVWIDSQTEEEIMRGIREAKDLSAYDNLSASAYLRAKEDYLMGINFSRVLTLRYGNSVSNYLNTKYPYVVHAEPNAILNSTASLKDSTLFVTLFPCNECAKLIIQSGIKHVVYGSDKYHDQDSYLASRRMFDAAGITYEKMPAVQVELVSEVEE